MAVKGNRKRYILFKIISDREISFENAERAILHSSLALLGEVDAGKANVRLMPEFWQKNGGVISLNHNYIPKVKLSLALIKQINSQKVIVYSEKVFGTLKKIKNMFKEVV
jgi:RNase P/RNase MRP subunit POP5